MSNAIARLAELQKQLKLGEFYLLFDLVFRANGAGQVACSSRDLVRSTGLARTSVQKLIDQLNAKAFIKTLPGRRPFDPSVHHLLFLKAVLPSRPDVLERAAAGGAL